MTLRMGMMLGYGRTVRSVSKESSMGYDIGTDRTEDVASLLSSAQGLLDIDAAAACQCLMRAVALLHADTPVASSTASTHRAPATPARARGLAPWQLKRLTAHIDAHLGSRLRTADLAEVAGLSVSHFCHAFKTTVGVPPAAFIGRRRIDAASAMMMATDEPLTRIAHLHGFCDQSHFTRTFRRELGMAPQAWRRLRQARLAG